MGFFSWDCKGCNHSVREGQGWMSKCLVQGEDGSQVTGDYDGYGGVEGGFGSVSLSDESDFELWHHACFILNGRPAYSGPSRTARDQGMAPADELSEPKSPDDLRALKELSATADRKEKQKAERRAACQISEDALLGAEAKCPHCRFDTFFVVEKKGTLMIRCPNRECSELRAFPPKLVGAWRALAATFPEQPVIWDDRKVGPHFRQVESILTGMKWDRDELEKFGNDPMVGRAFSAAMSERMKKWEQELAAATAEAEAKEAAELELKGTR